MQIIQGKDYDDMSRKAANIISAQVILKPNCVLGLATGSTPLGTYANLINWHEKGDLDFSNVSSVNLDEYRGLPADNDQSYRYFMKTNLFDKINIDQSRTHVPNGMEPDSEKACRDHDSIIKELGGIDLQLLGLGLNGHIGFNEPDDHFVKETHVVDLAESTIDANARFFATRDDVPKQAISMGIGAIMGAKKVLLCASGEDKADAIYNSVCGPITPKCPGSILQLHKNVVLVADEAALSKLIAAGVEV